MQWAVIDGRKRLLVSGKINRLILNPTWPVGCRTAVSSHG
jgi:hypothetical protein